MKSISYESGESPNDKLFSCSYSTHSYSYSCSFSSRKKGFVSANSILIVGTTIYLTQTNYTYQRPTSSTQSYSENEVFTGGTFCFVNAATLPFKAILLSRALRQEEGTCSKYVNSACTQLS